MCRSRWRRGRRRRGPPGPAGSPRCPDTPRLSGSAASGTCYQNICSHFFPILAMTSFNKFVNSSGQCLCVGIVLCWSLAILFALIIFLQNCQNHLIFLFKSQCATKQPLRGTGWAWKTVSGGNYLYSVGICSERVLLLGVLSNYSILPLSPACPGQHYLWSVFGSVRAVTCWASWTIEEK